MTDLLYLAWRYLVAHRLKTGLLVASIAIASALPAGLRMMVAQGAEALTARAAATPLLIGARGSPLELVLSSLYFDADPPETLAYAEVARVEESGLARAVPLWVRFRAGGQPIVGTRLTYFEHRGLRLAEGRMLALLGECVLGARAAQRLQAGPGDAVVSSPESVFDLAGVYPLRMPVVGVLAPSFGPDDDAVFVDLKTAWVVAGLGHGHQDLRSPEAAGAVLSRENGTLRANASLREYAEITDENRESFHFHGDLSAFPVTAVLALPVDERARTLLMGRYQGSTERQSVRPLLVIEDLLATVFTVERTVRAALLGVGLATLAIAAIVFVLSWRLRRREIETLWKLGASRGRVVALALSEAFFVLAVAALASVGLTLLAAHLGPMAMQLWVST